MNARFEEDSGVRVRTSIELSGELEARLKKLAARRGVTVS
jgi:hypothetical protein